MEGEFQDQGHLDQELEEWLSPRGSQYVHGFFSEEEKQQSIQTEDSAPEGETSTFAPVRWIIQRRDGYSSLVRNRPRCQDELLHLVQRR